MNESQGLYWLRPLIDSLGWAIMIVGSIAWAFLVAEVLGPRARANRAKLRARRRLHAEMAVLREAYTGMQVQIGEALIPAFRNFSEVTSTVGDHVRSLGGFLDALELQGQLADADQPHVLVASWAGGLGPASGPYEDLWQATAAAPVWEASLNDGADDERDDPVFVMVMPMFAPGT